MEIDLEEPTRPQIAAVLGVSSRWIGELRSKGDLPADGASLLENLEAWAQAKYGIEGAQDALDLDAESARLKKEQADSKAMDNAERRKELVSLPDMYAAVAGLISITVARLGQVGAQVAKGDDYDMACEAVPAHLRPIFEAVICRNESISGVAATMFSHKRSQGEGKVRAAVKTCANLLFDRIKPLLNVEAPMPAAQPSAPVIVAPQSQHSLADELQAAIAERGAPADLVEIWIAGPTWQELCRQTGGAVDAPTYRGFTMHVVDTWSWGWLFNATG